MDENKNSSKVDDLDICCDCGTCKLMRDLKHIPEPTSEERTLAFKRLAALGGATTDQALGALRHAVEKMFRNNQTFMQPNASNRIDWFGEGQFKLTPDRFEKEAVDYATSRFRKLFTIPGTPEAAKEFFLRPIPEPLRAEAAPEPNASRSIQTKAQLTLDVFDQLKALIDDGGWDDKTDKAIALMRLAECRLLWATDNADEGL